MKAHLSFLALLALPAAACPQIPAFPLSTDGPVISRPVQPQQPFTVAGPRGVLVGTQDGQFESWVLPVKLLSHLTIEANVEGYSVPIEVNPQSAQIEVRPDRTTLTYAHIAFTLRQIMFSHDCGAVGLGFSPGNQTGQQKGALAPEGCTPNPSTGPIVLFQIDSPHPVDLTFRFTPEMRWMWPKRNDGIPGAEWSKFPSTQNEPGVPPVPPLGPGNGYYILHMDYPDLAGAITIPSATPGILAPYQERPQVHPLELHLHYDPKRDTNKYFPLLMAVGTTPATATNTALAQSLANLNSHIPALYSSHAEHYKQLLAETTSIQTPDKALNEAFQWGVVSIEQLKTHEFASNQDALVAGYYASGDSARPGFGWFFGRDALYTLYAVNGFGDFALTRAELEFLIARQRQEGNLAGKIMHEYAQTAADPSVNWQQFPYMYAAADATPLFLMALRDYYRASGDFAFLQAHKEAIEKAWAFESNPAHDTDHDGIYDNSQGTGWVESWPHGAMPHQEIYLALLDEQASEAYAALATALGNPANSTAATTRAQKIASTIEQEYYDPQKGCYAFSHNLPNDPNGETDKSTTVYPAIAWWDASSAANSADPANSAPSQPLTHAPDCLHQFASPSLATDWGLRDVATTEPFYDGMSYHQGSVWPLFTGWAALAEYRGNQPLAGEQMLMQNVDLTWAQDPGAVTELLSGDTFVPFGRSTSHQLWSSAMVLTPTLRGLFGISLDAATNTITVNPHLPGGWKDAEVRWLHIGGQTANLSFERKGGLLHIRVFSNKGDIHLKSDLPGAKSTESVSATKGGPWELTIPLPAVEIARLPNSLPVPGSSSSQIKIISTEYQAHSLTVKVQGQPDTSYPLQLERNQKVMPTFSVQFPKDYRKRFDELSYSDAAPSNPAEPIFLELHFPPGQGWQTLEFTLTW